MARAANKHNAEAGLSVEDLTALGEHDPVADVNPAPSQADIDAYKAQIAALVRQNAAQARLLEAKDNEAKVAAPELGSANSSHASTKARYAITIDEGHDKNDTPDCLVGVNGRMYQIKRGVRAEVPPEVLHVLDNALITKHIPIEDDRGMPNGTITRASRRFPYQNHGMVVDAAGLRIER